MEQKNHYRELLKTTIVELVHWEVDNVKRKLGNGLELEDISEELRYWGPICVPPNHAYDQVYFYKYKDNSGFTMEFNLWIDNKVSDLTLTCEAITDEDDNVSSFTIENLHVL